MKIAVIASPGAHSESLLDALITGIASQGDQVLKVRGLGMHPNVDAFACWGWRTGKRIRLLRPSMPVLVVERGYIGDRFTWTSLGWNGLNGRAIFPKPRYPDSVPPLYMCEAMKPWPDRGRSGPFGYALILGQVQSDQACVNINLAYQYRAWRDFLMQRRWAVKFRPHPKALRQPTPFRSAECTYGTLADDLAGAAFTVTWNSNSAVDSVLAGVPSVTFDKGAMAWPVTSHSLDNPVTMPNRTEWAAQLAWCQWQPAELSDGSAWRAVREVMPK